MSASQSRPQLLTRHGGAHVLKNTRTRLDVGAARPPGVHQPCW